MIVQIIGWFALINFVVEYFYVNNKNLSSTERYVYVIDTTLLLICAAICFK